jgi:signal transduction histidine kinase
MPERGGPVAVVRRGLNRVPAAAADVALIVLVSGFAILVLAGGGELETGQAALLVALLVWLGTCVALARRHPVAAGLLACPALAISALTPSGSTADEASSGALVLVFLLAFRLGCRLSPPISALLVAAIATSWLATSGGFNPFIVVDSLGPWAVGVAVRARVQTQAELELRTAELIREQERQVAESVRYERTRIARELHDIVAHCVSVMVVQAGAGGYLAATDPAAARDALANIADQADQAADEVDRLFALLDPTGDAAPRSLEELVGRARSSGLTVSYVLTGPQDQLDAAAFDATFRITREALTNAVKHSPGAPIDIVLASRPQDVELLVTNGPARSSGLGLSSTGGRWGLAGMRERLAEQGGRLDSGPTDEGGWQVRAVLPRRLVNQTAAASPSPQPDSATRARTAAPKSSSLR